MKKDLEDEPMRHPSCECQECEKLAQDLREAWKADRRALQARLEAVAAASGRDSQRMKVDWIFSIAEMPDDETRVLLEAQYPRVAEARRNQERHRAITGHWLGSRGWTVQDQASMWWMLTRNGFPDAI
jgi:hypothetical protein